MMLLTTAGCHYRLSSALSSSVSGVVRFRRPGARGRLSSRSSVAPTGQKVLQRLTRPCCCCQARLLAAHASRPDCEERRLT